MKSKKKKKKQRKQTDDDTLPIIVEEEIKEIEKKSHYINNKKFFDEMIEWKTKVNEAQAVGEPVPPVTPYIGQCFMEIAENLAKKPNLMNYPFKEDMIGDGIENCLMYCSNFDPDKSNNPFSYFTQIIYYAFLRRIQKEKKQQATKYKIIENLNLEDMFANESDINEVGSQFLDYMKKQLDQVDIDKRSISKPKLNFLAEEIDEPIDDDQSPL